MSNRFIISKLYNNFSNPYQKSAFKLFITFLKKNNALDDFFNNFDYNRKNIQYKNINPSSFIMKAFTWSNSLQGHHFWQSLHIRWDITLVSTFEYYNITI